MRHITVEISGVKALLQHRFSERAEGDVEATTRTIGVVNKRTPREEAESVAYLLPSGQLFLPGAAIARLLREAGANHKIKGSRKSVKFLVPSAIIVLDDAIPLHHPDTGEPLTTFEVDSRPVVIPATKGRVMRHRPRLDEWAARFEIEIDDDLLEPAFVQQLLTEGGQKLGVGDFRPERGGPFGRFAVVSWRNGG